MFNRGTLAILGLLLFAGFCGAQERGDVNPIISGPNAEVCFEPAPNAGPDACLKRTAPGVISLTPGIGNGTAIAGGSGVVGGTFGGSPSSAYTFSVSAGTVTAVNNSTGVVAFTGTDAAVVINSALAAVSTTGGRLFFKNGVYNLNSATAEVNSGCTNFYAIGIPPNSYGSFVQFIFEGETRTSWVGEIASAGIQTNGVIFNVTSSAVTAAGSSFLSAIWQRPNASGTSCTLSTGAALSNELYFKNMTVRFPTNTRGNECGICVWAGGTVDYENVLADFNLTYTAIATGSAPVAGTSGSFGLSSTYSSSGNLQHFKDTYAVGYNIGYDLESEHVVGDTMTAIYCNVSAEFGRQGTAIFHPIVLTKFTDQENGAGFIFGPQMVQGSRVDMLGLDFEFGGDSNWYSTARAKTGKLTESNPGNTTGILTYEITVAGLGAAAELPAASLFSSGGAGFQSFEATVQPNIAILAGQDSFTRANASSLGPAWLIVAGNGVTCPLIISSNAATSTSGANLCIYVPQTVNNDQFVKATMKAVDTNGIAVLARGSTAAQTYYDYLCATSGGRLLRKRVAGTFTTLASTASNCVANDTIELDVIGSSLFAYYNGQLDLIATDSSVASGSPGIVIGAPTDSFINFSGGSLPLKDATRSLYSQPAIHSTYNTLSNCNPGSSVSPAACGSAPSGTVVVPTTTATYTVNTTAVTANSRIHILPITDATGLTGAPTCVAPPTPFIGYQSARVAGTSFTFTLPSTTGASCWTYQIFN